MSNTDNKGNFTTKNKVRSIEDIKPGDRLYRVINDAVFKVIKVESRRALLEIITQSAQIRATPHIAIEEWFTAPGDIYWVFFDYESACDWYETDADICAWSIYLDELFVLPEASQIESAFLTGSKLELELSNGGKISTIIPKLVLPKPEALRKVRDQGEEALLDSCIQKIVEQNSEGKTSLKMEYAELLTLKSKLEESGYLVDLADCEISW